MIANVTGKLPTHCITCGRKLVRSVSGYCKQHVGGGNRTPDPTPDEIAVMCCAIRETWPKDECYRRSGYRDGPPVYVVPQACRVKMPPESVPPS